MRNRFYLCKMRDKINSEKSGNFIYLLRDQNTNAKFHLLLLYSNRINPEYPWKTAG